MHLPLPTIPLLDRISTLHLFNIVALLLLLSYYHKRSRHLLAGLVLTLIAYKTLIPIVRLAYKIFRWIAMLGFYVHYFEIGVRVISAGYTGVIIFCESLISGIAAAQWAAQGG